MRDWLQNSIETFQFSGETAPFVDIRSLVEKLGLDWPTQRDQLIANDHWSYREQRMGDHESHRDICGLPAAKLMVWLKTIDVNKVSPALREPLSEYQEQSRIMTRQAFLNSDLLAFARAKTPETRSALEQQLVEAAELLLRESEAESSN